MLETPPQPGVIYSIVYGTFTFTSLELYLSSYAFTYYITLENVLVIIISLVSCSAMGLFAAKLLTASFV